MEFRNGAKMRNDVTQAAPSSCSRSDVYSMPHQFGLKDDLLDIDVDVVRDIKVGTNYFNLSPGSCLSALRPLTLPCVLKN